MVPWYLVYFSIFCYSSLVFCLAFLFFFSSLCVCVCVCSLVLVPLPSVSHSACFTPKVYKTRTTVSLFLFVLPGYSGRGTFQGDVQWHTNLADNIVSVWFFLSDPKRGLHFQSECCRVSGHQGTPTFVTLAIPGWVGMCPGFLPQRTYPSNWSTAVWVSHLGDKSSIPTSWSRHFREDLYDLYDLYDLAHVTGWEPYNLHDLQVRHVSWVGCVLYMILPHSIS